MPFYRRRTGYRRRYGSSYRRGGSIAAQVGRAIRRATYNSDMAERRAAIAGTRRYKTVRWPVGSTNAAIKGVFGDPDAGLTAEQQAMRDITGFRGKGGYWGRLIGRALGGDRGAAWGDRLGDIGAAAIRSYVPGGGAAMTAVDMLGSAHRAFTGQGAYTSNALVNGGVDGIPEFAPQSDGGIIVTSKEYICDVFAPATAGAFNVQTFPINPGIEKTFPWLCQLAENYDEYTLLQCIFTYKSTVADFAAASGQVGQVLMATQYNVAQAPFPDKQTMMQYAGAISGKTSQDILEGVECDPVKLSGPDGRFVRNGPVPAGYFGDLNNYDHGKLNLAVVDTPATYAGQQMGELWVSYTVKLNKPKFVSANGWGISRDVFVGNTEQSQMCLFGLKGSGAMQLLNGQQNSLGSQIVRPAATGDACTLSGLYPGELLYGPSGNPLAEPMSFAVLFPPEYSGQVKITMRGIINIPHDNVFQIITNASASGQLCQIRPIADMYLVTGPPPAGSWTPVYAGGENTAPTNNAYTIELHIKVSAQSDGIPNAILFICKQGSVGTNWSTMLDVEEYNTIFNYRQDGSNDTLVLQQTNGNVVTIP